MREILYRGFHPDENGTTTITLNGKQIEGEWVEGFFTNHCVDHYYIPRIERTTANDSGLPINYIGVEYDTVGEFTSLTDKNGKKIFEGDIVKITDEIVNGIYYAYIEFGNPNGLYTWGWQLVPLCKTPFAVEILHWVDMEESGAFIEVIGNIYENPELLEDKHNG